MTAVYLVGVGMTPFGKFLDSSLKDLTRVATSEALADAGCAKEALGAAFFANATQSAMEGQFMVGGEIALRSMGICDIPVVNTENACASGATAFHLACVHIAAGECDIALAVGAEKMYSRDKSRTFAVFNGAWDVSDVKGIAERLQRIGEGVEPPHEKAGDPGVRSVFMDVYAALAKAHMKRFGSTERQLAAVASKNHRHSTMNPLSQYRHPISVDEVLNARLISWPLTLPMCAPISDGAVAAILCGEEALSRFDRSRALRVAASVLVSGSDREHDEVEKHICRRAALKAYDRAGIGPEDIDVAEVHDASAFAEIVQAENLGFCEFGQGGWIAERGETSIGGRIPINPSGGLESKGHPIGATGIGQIVELATQLRGEAGQRQVEHARFAIAENGGGFHGYEEAAAAVTILRRP